MPVCLSSYFDYIRMTSAWGFQCLSNFESNFVFIVGLGLSDASDELDENILQFAFQRRPTYNWKSNIKDV